MPVAGGMVVAETERAQTAQGRLQVKGEFSPFRQKGKEKGKNVKMRRKINGETSSQLLPVDSSVTFGTTKYLC